MDNPMLRAAAERIADGLGVPWDTGLYKRVSVKRRTWRTLWLVKRTYRVKVPLVRIRLDTLGLVAEPPPPDPALIRRLTSEGTMIVEEPRCAR